MRMKNNTQIHFIPFNGFSQTLQQTPSIAVIICFEDVVVLLALQAGDAFEGLGYCSFTLQEFGQSYQA